MSEAANDKLWHDVLNEWDGLPSAARKTEEQAWAFVRRNMSKWPFRGPAYDANKEKKLALGIIAYQARINEPLELFNPSH
jgi:hypothetical protein